MSDFHKTRMGRKFFESDVPNLVRSLNEISDHVKYLKKEDDEAKALCRDIIENIDEFFCNKIEHEHDIEDASKLLARIHEQCWAMLGAPYKKHESA